MAVLTVVFDTSVLIPLAIRASLSTRLFFRLQSADWEIAVSPQILREVAEKVKTKQSVRQWLKLSDEKIDEFLNIGLPGMVRLIAGVRNAHGAVPKDPKDDMIIAAALESGASYIVSEDRHLLDLGEYQGIKILNRRAFAAELDRLGVPAGA